MREAQRATRFVGLEAVTSDIPLPEDIAPTFDALNGRVEAIYLCSDPLAVINRVHINTLAPGMRSGVRRGRRADVLWRELARAQGACRSLSTRSNVGQSRPAAR